MPAGIPSGHRHGVLVFVDEAHSVGMYGPGGAGMAAELGCAADVDLLMGTFAKGYGTAGGYVTGTASIIDAVRSFVPAFMFTLALPPALAAAALTSVRHLRESGMERIVLGHRTDMLKTLLAEAGIPLVSAESHIVPVLVGDPHACRELADRLLDKHGCYAQPINFPSVACGTERLRINPSPVHSPKAVRHFAAAFSAALGEVDDEIAVDQENQGLSLIVARPPGPLLAYVVNPPLDFYIFR